MVDQTRLIAMAIAAFVLYYLYQEYGYMLNVKNAGTLNLLAGSDVEHETEMEQYVPKEKGQKHMVHPQIDEIQADDAYMNNVKSDELYKNNTNVLPNPQMSNNYSPQGNFSQLDCFPKDQLVAQDLLPRENAYNIWSESNPPTQGHLSNKNYIESGHHYGLNTQGSTLKNPNLQLRSDPHIPMRSVGPWSQSTYEADTNRRPFEIGGY